MGAQSRTDRQRRSTWGGGFLDPLTLLSGGPLVRQLPLPWLAPDCISGVMHDDPPVSAGGSSTFWTGEAWRRPALGWWMVPGGQSGQDSPGSSTTTTGSGSEQRSHVQVRGRGGVYRRDRAGMGGHLA